MNVLIIGSGGREHALGWKLKQSKNCGKIFFAPGNAGTASIGKNVSLDLSVIDQKSADAVWWFCKQEKVELVVIGPEDPLAGGLTDKLEKYGLKVFGPRQQAAQLEADKAWAKQIMRGAGVPTAEARTFENAEAAIAYVQSRETPVVVKAAGLAKGKGVVVCDNAQQAVEAVKQIMVKREFGDAGSKVVIEERLVGQEVSILALVDGRNIYVLDSAQDHKQVGEGDTGPNTGGMGAYSPTPLVNDKLLSTIEREVLVATVDALRRDEIEFKGVMYAGLMLTAGGPKVLEFNARFGDPETQTLLVRFKGDLLATLLAVVDGTLDKIDIRWDDRVSCCVVMCSGGYPGPYVNGIPITGLDEAAKMPDVHIFHAGTKLDGTRVVTNGGRVLNVVGLGKTIAEARDKANAACQKIKFEGGFYRRDIGDRVLKPAAKGR
jgi:phosphoribosylamine--glycine ligase